VISLKKAGAKLSMFSTVRPRVTTTSAPSRASRLRISFTGLGVVVATTSDFDRARADTSPDRLDALVWALSELMLQRQVEDVPIVSPVIVSAGSRFPWSHTEPRRGSVLVVSPVTSENATPPPPCRLSRNC
jgi:hypothetical protein